ncbi:MAG: nuclear transport factor 2 family protein [Gemmatimonadota bacterium]
MIRPRVRGALRAALPLLLLVGPALEAQGSAGARPRSAAGPAQQVRRAFNLLISAANRLDAEGEGDFFWRSPELVSVAQGTPTFGWEERQARTSPWYASLARQKIRPLDVQTRVLAPDAVALLASYAQEIEAKDGRAWKGAGVWSLLFRRLDGDWRVVWEHYSYEE